MKKLIIILMLFSLTAKAQDYVYFVGVKVQEDKLNHFGAGFMIGSVGNLISYDFLKDTNLKPWQSKTISFGIGAGLGILAGHLKEEYDNKKPYNVYSKADFRYTLYGALSGSLTVRLVIWNSVPISKATMEQLWRIEQSY